MHIDIDDEGAVSQYRVEMKRRMAEFMQQKVRERRTR
jgi:hypothetical protein